MNVFLDHLQPMIAKGRLPHGLLFVGEDAQAKRIATLDVARTLFCSAGKPAEACGRCLSCTKVSAGTHPDVRTVEAEDREIKIEQIRDFIRWLSIGPNEAPRKLGVLAQADNLNTSAANALLKTLEEPPPYATVLLSVRSTNNLLSTIRSRLMLIRFPAPADGLKRDESPPAWVEELESILQRKPPVAPDDLFAFTELVSKDRESLGWFFERIQRHLLDTMKRSPENRRAERLFDLSIALERDTMRRYGNVGLALDHLLLECLT
jgi:hypothetical protein